MMEIKKPKITFEENESKSYAKFVVEPLERGFGTTLGNSLRRVLLSSLPGAAAVGIKIEGVDHEFSTIKGVKEEVTEIILNIKTVRFKVSHAQEKAGKVKLRLYADTACTVTAGDIELPADVEVLNPEQEICTIDEGGRLDMIIYVDCGRGYVPQSATRTAMSPSASFPSTASSRPSPRSTTPWRALESSRASTSTSSPSKSPPTAPSRQRRSSPSPRRSSTTI